MSPRSSGTLGVRQRGDDVDVSVRPRMEHAVVFAVVQPAHCPSNDEGFRGMPHTHQNTVRIYSRTARISALTFRSAWDGAACLAEATGLSTAATAEHLKRLQNAGVLREVHADLDLARVGLPVPAIIGITTGNLTHRRCRRHRARVEVLEWRHVTGTDLHVMTIAVADMAAPASFPATSIGWGRHKRRS